MKSAPSLEALWAGVASLTEEGELRRLSGTFARFVASLGAVDAPPSLVLACVLLSELEGRGHSCLMLDELAADPVAMMGWSEEQWQSLAAGAGPLPKQASGWVKQLAGCEQVWLAGDLDFEQPLVLDGERLYLRRYWRDEMLVAHTVRSRAAGLRSLNPAPVRRSAANRMPSHP